MNTRPPRRHICRGVLSISRRVAPMIPAFHAVAGDPAGQVWERNRLPRHDGMVDFVATLTKKASLRKGVAKDLVGREPGEPHRVAPVVASARRRRAPFRAYPGHGSDSPHIDTRDATTSGYGRGVAVVVAGQAARQTVGATSRDFLHRCGFLTHPHGCALRAFEITRPSRPVTR